MRDLLKLFAVFFLSECFMACTIEPIVPPPASSTPQLPVRRQSAEAVPDEQGKYTGTYHIRALDPLVIQLTGIPEPQQIDAAVDANGQITLPHLGPVTAAGMTPSELSRNIEHLYMEQQIYRTVFVNITVTAKNYYVQGEVNASGQYPLVAGTTLMQALAAAHGTTPFASHKVLITRDGQVYKYDINKIEHDPSTDVEIEAGDIIKVLQSWF